MTFEIMVERSLPYLRLLTNTISDRAMARELLKEVDIEIIKDLQTILAIGIIVEERGNPFADTRLAYTLTRQALSKVFSREEEIQYLLHSGYKMQLQLGMNALGLSEYDLILNDYSSIV